jgi:hypothetical protein
MIRVALPRTPASARKLMRVARLTGSVLDPAIEDLSQEDRIRPDDIEGYGLPDVTAIQVEAIQFMLDHNLRAAIARIHAELIPVLPLIAARIANVPVTIASNQKRKWLQVGEKIRGLDVEVMDYTDALRSRHEGRDGLILIDWNKVPRVYDPEPLFAGLCREFRHAIIFGDPADDPTGAYDGRGPVDGRNENPMLRRFRLSMQCQAMAASLHPYLRHDGLLTKNHNSLRELGITSALLSDIAALRGLYMPHIN